jgi:iron complex outermembrane receptor protein
MKPNKLLKLSIVLQRYLLLSSYALLSTATHAQEQSLTEDDFLSETPFVSSPAYFQQKLSDSPASVTIIDRDMIRLSGAIEIVEVLRLVPGMMSYYVNGGRFGMAYHAFSDEYPRRMEVKVDGRSVYDPLTSSVDWTSLGLDLADIDRIEVIRGPNASSDGSNAFQATVNIYTTNPLAQKGTTVRLLAGDQQTRNASLVESGTLGEIDYRATLSYENNQGFSDYVGDYACKGQGKKDCLEELVPDTRGISDVDETEARIFNLRAIYSPSLINSFDVDIGFGDNHVGLGGDHEAEGDNFFQNHNTVNHQSILWTHQLSAVNRIETRFYHNRNAFDCCDYTFLLSDAASELTKKKITPALLLSTYGVEDTNITTSSEGNAERYDVELRQIYQQKTVQASVGGSFRHDIIDSDSTLDQHSSVDEQTARVYLNTAWDALETTTLNAGASHEENSTVDPHNSYRVSINQHLDAYNTLRLGHSYTTRAPSNFEANERLAIHYKDIVIDELRRPDDNQSAEKLIVNEAGYLGIFFNNALQVDVRLFKEDYRDIMDEFKYKNSTTFKPNNTGRTIAYSNVASLINHGAEFTITYKNASGFLLAVQSMWQNPEGERKRKAYEKEVNYLDTSLPEYTGGFLIGYTPWQDWEVSAHYTYQSQVGCIRELESCSVHTQKGWLRGNFTEEYDRTDIRLARNFQIGNSSGTLALIGQNVFDSSITEFHSFNNFESRYYLSLSLNF